MPFVMKESRELYLLVRQMLHGHHRSCYLALEVYREMTSCFRSYRLLKSGMPLQAVFARVAH